MIVPSSFNENKGWDVPETSKLLFDILLYGGI